MVIMYWSSDVCSSDLLEGLAGHDLARPEPLADQLHDGDAGVVGEVVPAAVDGGGAGAARQRHAERLGHAGHGVRREHAGAGTLGRAGRSEEHTSELQSLMRISYAVFCLKKKNN